MNYPQDPNNPGTPDGGEPAFGFQPAAKREEKYDTLYLVSNLLKDRQRTHLYILGTVAAVILGIIFWVAIKPEPKPPAIKPAETAVQPLAPPPPTAAAPAAPTPAPAPTQP